jgi:hypothetical protein
LCFVVYYNSTKIIEIIETSKIIENCISVICVICKRLHSHYLLPLPINHPLNGGYVDEIKIGEPAVEFWGVGLQK